MTGIEVIKGKWSIKIAEYNSKIQSLSEPIEETHAIGFVIPSEEEDDFEDD